VPIYLGIDPSKRHIGLALSKDEVSPPLLKEISPTERDLLNAVRTLRIELFAFLRENMSETDDLVVGIEKQGMGGESALTMFVSQMACFEVLSKVTKGKVTIVWPLPIQGKSYMKKKHGVDTDSKSSTVRSWAATFGQLYPKKRYSNHCVEAFYFMKMAKDVVEGRFSYRPPSQEDPTVIIPFKVEYGVEFNGSTR